VTDEKNKLALAPKPQDAEKPHACAASPLAPGPFEILRLPDGHSGFLEKISGEISGGGEN